jgi:serine-type D-Ala-D-Ala carboxypeptidase/endopeptidase (penicillin-binding protein 4)
MLKKLIICAFILFSIFYQGKGQNVRERFIGLENLLGQGTFFDNHLTGFMLFDLDSQTGPI